MMYKKYLVYAFIFIIILSKLSFTQERQLEIEGDISGYNSAIFEKFSQNITGKILNIDVSIKIMQEGEYWVIGGFVKDRCFHKGAFSKKIYYSSKLIKGKEGEIINLSLKIPKPPMNKKTGIGIFKSKNDICTRG
jgi:hypothetical protein